MDIVTQDEGSPAPLGRQLFFVVRSLVLVFKIGDEVVLERPIEVAKRNSRERRSQKVRHSPTLVRTT